MGEDKYIFRMANTRSEYPGQKSMYRIGLPGRVPGPIKPYDGRGIKLLFIRLFGGGISAGLSINFDGCGGFHIIRMVRESLFYTDSTPEYTNKTDYTDHTDYQYIRPKFFTMI